MAGDYYFGETGNSTKCVDIGGYRLKFRDGDLINEMYEGFIVIPCYVT